MQFHPFDFTDELLQAIAECDCEPMALRSRSRDYVAQFEAASLEDRFRLLWLAETLAKLAARVDHVKDAPLFNPCTRLGTRECWREDGHDGDCPAPPF